MMITRYLCRPLLSNIPDAPDPAWELVRCDCGNLCWRLPAEPYPLRGGVVACCTTCVLKAVAAVPPAVANFDCIEHVVLKDQCPACHHTIDMATSVTGQARPKPGDATICIGCGELLFYGEKLQVHRPTREELSALDQDHWSVIRRCQADILHRGKLDSKPDSKAV